MSDQDDFRTGMLARQAEAEEAMVLGDPAPRMELWSRWDPVTLLGAATGSCKTGWVDQRLPGGADDGPRHPRLPPRERRVE
jgi:hypothetical protein